MINMRGRPQPKFSEDEIIAIKKELKKKQTVAVRKRLMILSLKASGEKNSKEIAAELQMHQGSVNKIVHQYKKEGLPSMITRAFHKFFTN